MGPSAPPAPEPIEFLRNYNDSGGIPHPENAQKSQETCGISRISHIFTKKAEMTEIHDFLSISRFGVAEPSRNLPRRYDYKGFATPGERRHPLQQNIVNTIKFI